MASSICTPLSSFTPCAYCKEPKLPKFQKSRTKEQARQLSRDFDNVWWHAVCHRQDQPETRVLVIMSSRTLKSTPACEDPSAVHVTEDTPYSSC
ncbi:uncharacterized protein BO66DRAFT_70639 [Aspergillus aculeatinus CBS 121060]|uniref:Uncharacterized protein n=1 Tax=Aspergillus aculeatinus CBS 121060 TaxID=1448322 RepID=A0ACD1HM88_9EURO|nr:hypothetical protein BO66DRAFT_70639 [Aspergillus aculeatinus CBS 121060]RAH74979.1 hypothetical protein BO66DRAFT_70639 [Aspergillus aculeatinus CBS 121060]